MKIIILGLAVSIIVVISFLIGYEDFTKAIVPFIERMRRGLN